MDRSSLSGIRGVLFDFDGTLTHPGALDFAVIRQAIGCPAGETILEFISHLKSRKRLEALKTLDRFESEAAAASQPNAGAEELLEYLRSQNIPVGIISRNRLKSVLRALENFKHISASNFKVIISRDDRVAIKPDPAGIQMAAERMGVDVQTLLVVGDYIFDVTAGQKAGAQTAFLTNGANPPSFERPPDLTVENLEELKEFIRHRRPLPPGKLPNELLQEFLHEPDDPSLLIGPGVGEDAAAVRLEEGPVLVLKSDPITLTTGPAAEYLIAINSNDLAACGATPRWLLTTLLFPLGYTADQIRVLMNDLQGMARQFGVTLCGGHTEITDAVKRPVAVGFLVGTVPFGSLIDKRRMREGEPILLTKRLAVEGTAILSRDFPDQLKALGVPGRHLKRAQHFLHSPGISILNEAQIAVRSRKVSALHDITEGGLMTALEELSAAGGHRLRVHLGRIPIFSETRRICSVLDISPLGLIASGSLLMVCRPGAREKLTRQLHRAGIEVSCIGEVLGPGVGIEAVNRRGKPVESPHFEIDEISRAIAQLNA